MANQFNLKILTPEGVAFDGLVDNFDTTTEKGRIGIYANMTKMVCLLKPNISVVGESNNKKIEYLITGGLMYVEPNMVKVFSDLCFEKSKVNSQELKKEISNLSDLIAKTTKQTLINSYQTQKKQKEILLSIISE